MPEREYKKAKKITAPFKTVPWISVRSSDSACNFAGTKATSTCINSLGRAVHYSLDPFNVGLPGSVWTSVRMGNLDAERHILTAIFAFCHVSHLLLYSVTDDMITDNSQKSKLFFIFCSSQHEKLENNYYLWYNITVKSRAGYSVDGTYADMAELADAPDLGSGGQPCRFDPCYPHHNTTTLETQCFQGLYSF